MVKLEDELKAVRTKAEEADKAYDEVSKKIQVENTEDNVIQKYRNVKIQSDYRNTEHTQCTETQIYGDIQKRIKYR